MSAASGLPGLGPCPRPFPPVPLASPSPLRQQPRSRPWAARRRFLPQDSPCKGRPGPWFSAAGRVRGKRRGSPVTGEGSARLSPAPHPEGVLLSCETPHCTMLWVLKACQ